jgi:AcrR family transcriptional regulator
MTTRASATDGALGSTRYSPAQLRVAGAAMELIAAHGVNGTSLQMIADALGVTKAAVYHQFKTKEAIVIAATEMELTKLDAALDAAEAEPGPGSRDALVRQVIDLSVARRRMVSAIQYDPVVVRLLSEQRPFQDYMARLFAALLGSETDAAARLRVAMVASAIGGVVTHPLVADLDDETLRNRMLDLAREFLGPERW